MYLKTLVLRGFKSFATTTRLRLEPGITCVVGPNGSGKSNVVDALAWVMGEQGAKSLRGGQMADVIFAGTAARPALGRAQVELTIDNADGALPIDYSEVTIARTLFRGGASEYAINGSPARLLDVQELLSDTGMGRQMHVIVGQGQLDQILSATPEERRGFIEEAAGVLKHRRRKERALRKIEDMDAKLVRVQDLANELHRQLRPLARQAEAARRAGEVQARVRDATARLLADALSGLRRQAADQDRAESADRRRREQSQAQLDQVRAALAEAEQRARQAGPETEELSLAWNRLTALRERFASLGELARDRERALAAQPAREPGEDPDDLEARARDSEDRESEAREREQAARRRLAQASAARERAEQVDAEAGRRREHVARRVSDRRENVARLVGDLGAARSALEAAGDETRRTEDQLRLAEQRRAEAERGAAEQQAEPSDPQGAARRAYEQAVGERDHARRDADELLGAERSASADRSRWEARRDALAEALAPDDATARLRAAPGVLGSVSERVRVEEGWEDAVSALLGPLADAAVVADLRAGVEQVRAARQGGLGQVRMAVAGGGSCADAKTRAPAPPGSRWARGAVRVEEPLGAAVDAVLARCVLCEDAESARVALADPAVARAATREGDVLARTAVVGSGSSGSSVLGLRAQWERAVARADAAGRAQVQASAALTRANRHLDQAVRRASDALKALRAEDAAEAARAEARARAASAAEAARAECGRISRTLDQLRERAAQAQERVDAARGKLGDARAVPEDEDLESAEERARAASEAARRAREAETKALLALRAAEESVRQSQGRAADLRRRAQAEREARAEAERVAGERARRGGRLARIAAAARIAGERCAQELRAVAQAREDAQRLQSRASTEAAQLRTRADALASSLAELAEAGHRGEVERAQTALRIEQLEARVLERVGLEPDRLLAEYGPDAPGGDGAPRPFAREQVEAELAAARRELARIGQVNPLALEQHEALEKRHQFLVDQVADLKRSKADLLTIVDDVDALVQEAFQAAFADTQRAFGHVFGVLFPGGEGRLVLTDPDHPLTTGIEIEARPAGKKVRRLSLLSGGERSLAALAFLVAIFQARPSPFYVMDEVEAALDDLNLSRLLAIFQELKRSSQLIVVTHQKRTMEIADVLYGVTMRDGMSRVVSQRLE